MSDLISIILPVYNTEEHIHLCINSILNQTLKNFEVIMIDDGSTDNSPAICDYYQDKDSRFFAYHKKNGGLSTARNYGIEKATGTFITFIDSDDYIDHDYLEYLYMLVTKYNTSMSLCQHRVHYMNGSVKDYGTCGDEMLSAEKCIERMLYHDVIDTSAWAKLYEKKLFDSIRYPEGKIFEDIATTYKLMARCEKISVGYESKYNYVFHENSIVNSKFTPKKLDLLEMTDIMAKDVREKYPRLEKAVLRRRVYARFSTLNQMLGVKNMSAEKKEIIKFIRENSRSILKNKKVPMRDKFAVILLMINFKLYKFFWLLYKKNRTGQ